MFCYNSAESDLGLHSFKRWEHVDGRHQLVQLVGEKELLQMYTTKMQTTGTPEKIAVIILKFE